MPVTFLPEAHFVYSGQTAAVAGMLGGTAATLNAQPTGAASVTAESGVADALAFQQTTKPKHACKGQGADGKNSCKGKGSCATDDSKPMPKM